MISLLSRSVLMAAFASILFVACSKVEEAAAPVEAPAVEAPAAAPAPEAATSGAGGYEPTEEERVPGITEPVAATN